MKVSINGVEYKVPALTLGQLRKGIAEKIRQHDQMVTDGKTFDAMYLRGEIVSEVLRAKHPELSDDAIADALDMENLGEAWLAVIGASPNAEAGPATGDPTTLGPSIGN